MKYYFSGTVSSSADDKNRYRFPAKYKDCFTRKDEYNNDVIEEVYILKTLKSNYLTIMPKDVAHNFIAQLQKKITVGETRETAIAKFYMSSIEASKVDNQGRFTISTQQMGGLNIGKDVVILGVGDKLEIWNKKDYEAYTEQLKTEMLSSYMSGESSSEIDNIVIGLE